MDNGSQNRSRRLWWILAVAIFAVVLVGVVLLLSRDSPEKSKQSADHTKLATAFMTALTNADGEASFELMSERLQNKVGGSIKWTDSVEAIFGKEGDRFRHGQVAEVQNASNVQIIRYSYRIEFADGTSRNVTITVKKVNGSWKVDQYDETPPTLRR